MDIESYREYCIVKPGVTEGFPFDNKTLVFKVMNKMFALCDVDTFAFINLKCDAERAIELREQYESIKPGYHMHKATWNSVYMDGTLPDNMIKELIDDSYALIVASLTKKLREELKGLS